MDGKQESWSCLPPLLFVLLLDRLESIEIKTVRKVCKGWRWAVDETVSRMKPRALKLPELAQRFPRILSLDTSRQRAPSDGQLGGIAGLTTLRELIVQGGCMTGNSSLALLADLSELTYLSIEDAKHLQDDGLIALTKLTNLCKLSFKGNDGIMGGGLTALQFCPKLQDLNLSQICNFSHCGTLAVAALTGLTSLQLAGCRLDRVARGDSIEEVMGIGGVVSEAVQQRRDAFVKLVSQLTGLQNLNVGDCGSLTADWISPHLSKLRSITALNIGDVTTTASRNAGVAALSALTTLRRLSIHGLGPLERSTVQKLSNLQGLTYLNLSLYQLHDKHIAAITRLSGLRELLLYRARRITNVAFKSIGRRFPLLESLHVSRGTFTTEGLQTFLLHKSLRKLHLEDCDKVSDRAGQVIGGLTALTSLNLSLNRFVNGEIAWKLRHLPFLASLDLSDCEWVTDRTIEGISTLTGLQHLDLCRDEVGEVAAVAVQPLTKLTYLGLARSEIRDTDLARISGLRNLRRLDVSGTCITDSGLLHLRGLTALQNLDIGYCDQITNSGVRSLGTLAVDHSLATLQVHGSKRVDQGVAEFLPCCEIRGPPTYWRAAVVG